MVRKKKKTIIVAASGGFDPLHIGHIQLFEEAKKLGDKLVVILNNDNWLLKKKRFVFMREGERKKILESLKWVDRVVVTKHKLNTADMSVNRELKEIRPDIFVNGGDRKKDNIPEVSICDQINCKMVFNIGKSGKIQSSSWLLNNFLKNRISEKKKRNIKEF